MVTDCNLYMEISILQPAKSLAFQKIIFTKMSPLLSSVISAAFKTRVENKMAKENSVQQQHKPGPLKQQNKSHKHGRHKTKGMLENINKGSRLMEFNFSSQKNRVSLYRVLL